MSQAAALNMPRHHARVPLVARALTGRVGHDINHHAEDQPAVANGDRDTGGGAETVGAKIDHCLHSTVTLLARLRGWSTSQPRSTPMWQASNCKVTSDRELL
jgi:hypothetical protein